MSSTRKTLQAVSDYFDLGLVLYSRRANGTNQNYFVATSKGEFLFKILVNETVAVSFETIEHAVPYLNRLEEYRFPFAA